MEQKFAIIGAGPAGLAGAKCLQQYGIPFDGFEAHSDVGGLWDIDNPHSTVYESAHLISSKRMTEFKDFPMKAHVADYPHHSELKQYFRDFAQHFNLYDHFRFQTKVKKVVPEGDKWIVTLENGESILYKGVIIANGTLSEPNYPEFKGEFSGEIMHSAQYKSASIFEGKRVLIVGAGNSGCDIAVDAVHRAKSVSLSMRRGYHFVPKYAFGKPADTIGGRIKLPRPLKQRFDTWLVRMMAGNPANFGFPAPDHKLYESHPIVNSLVLHYAGHGDLSVKPNIDRFEEENVHFSDGTVEAFDLVVSATGYQLHYPFIDRKYLNWQDMAPALYLNIFHPEFNNLFVLGMVEATGIGWQGRHDQAELLARFLRALAEGHPSAEAFIQRKRTHHPDTSGGYHYLKLHRMSFYVHKDTYLKLLHKDLKRLKFD